MNASAANADTLLRRAGSPLGSGRDASRRAWGGVGVIDDVLQ